MGYFRQALGGVGWMGSLKWGTRALGYIRIAVLARVLTPVQFGVFGIASIVLSFLEVLTQSGINVFFIQREGKVKEYVNEAWLISIIRGILVSSILFFSAKLISGFYSSPEAYSLLALISVVPLIRGFLNPSIINYQKNLKFKKEFNLRMAIYFLESLVVVFVALTKRTASSFVWGMIMGVILELVLSFALFKPTPVFKFSLLKLKKIARRGKWVTLAGIFRFAFEQGDDAVVGKVINTFSLGLYQAAYKISSLPLTEVTQVFGKVTFPIYVEIRGDKKRLKRAFIRTFAVISALVIPFGLLMYLFPDVIVRIILGPNWLEASSVLKALAIFGVARALFFTTNPLFMAVKKQEYVTITNAVSMVAMLFAIIPFIGRWGLMGAAYAGLLGIFVAAPFLFYFTIKVFKK